MDLDKVETETRAKPKAQPKWASPLFPQPETKGTQSLVPRTGIKPIPENMERVYDPDEDKYFLIPETITNNNTKDIIKLKLEPKPKDDIYSRIKFRCEECNEEFRKKIALTTHS